MGTSRRLLNQARTNQSAIKTKASKPSERASSKKDGAANRSSSLRKVSLVKARLTQIATKLKKPNPAKSVELKRVAKSRSVSVVSAEKVSVSSKLDPKDSSTKLVSPRGLIVKQKTPDSDQSSVSSMNKTGTAPQKKSVNRSNPAFKVLSKLKSQAEDLEASVSKQKNDASVGAGDGFSNGQEGRVLNGPLANTSSISKSPSVSIAASTSSNSFVVNPQIFRPRPAIQHATGKQELFKAGDKVVYPGHGVGILDEVVSKTVGGAEHTFYGITILDSKQTKIMVPVTQAHMVGLRKIVSIEQMQEVFEVLRRRSVKVDNQTWNRRSRDYTLKLKTGSLIEIAEVTRELSVLAKFKELSFGERKMLESAQYLLISELALVKDRSHEAILGELKDLIN